jgi:hypothetical protein
MPSTRALLLSVLGTVVLVPFVGCADPEPVTGSNVLANVDTSVSPQWTPPGPPAGTCPDPSIGSTQPTEYYQRRATTVMTYLVGGETPFAKKELDTNPECVAAYDCTTMLRTYLDTKGAVSLQPAVGDIVCGLPAALYAIDFSAQIPSSLYASMATCGTHLDNCWGVGVSGFYYAEPDQRIRRVYIDPEPARLSQNLTGSTGATAAAVYTTTLIETTVLKWPGSYTSSASPPPAGLPCSTGDLPEGLETLKIIGGSGSYRRCY